jgi:hypothetical protein
MAELTETDLVSIQDYFGDLEDPRSTINRKHLLGELIVICVASVIAGADGPKAIGVWAQSNAHWLKQHLTLAYGIPSHDTIGRLLAALRPAAFQSCFRTWIASVAGQADSPDSSHGSEELQQPITLRSRERCDSGVVSGAARRVGCLMAREKRAGISALNYLFAL